MVGQLAPAIRSTLTLAFYTGIVFPFFIFALAQLFFPHQANGSHIRNGDQTVGSELIGQGFTKATYFHPRPSAAGSGYAGEASGGTNYGPTSRKLILGDESFAGIKQLAESYRTENDLPPDAQVPVDAVTRSSSGLDPHISPANARSQAPRVATARHLRQATVLELVSRYTQERDLGVFGEPRVNVLKLNLALDSLSERLGQ